MPCVLFFFGQPACQSNPAVRGVLVWWQSVPRLDGAAVSTFVSPSCGLHQGMVRGSSVGRAIVQRHPTELATLEPWEILPELLPTPVVGW